MSTKRARQYAQSPPLQKAAEKPRADHVRATHTRSIESHQTFCEHTAHRFFDVRFGVRGACPLSEFADVWISRLEQ